VSLVSLLFASSAFADDAGRAKLLGAWELQGGADAGGRASWILEEKGESWQVTYTQGNQKPAVFECAIDGRECTAKDLGHGAKVSLYFNGSKLVEMETKGPEVVKRRFGISEKGDEMEVEVIPIVSNAVKAETLHFKRVNLAASK